MGIISNFLGIILFSLQSFREILRPPFRFSLVFKEIEFSGVRSLPIIAITSVFLGMVFTLHSIRAFSAVGMESLVGPSVMLSFARELASGFAGLIITGRVGAAYCSQIGTMKITEQLDALYIMGISPIQYVAVPKIVALAIVMPLIYFFFMFLGMIGGMISASFYSIEPFLFLKDVHGWVEIEDLVLGVVKSSAFGMTIGFTSCYFGFITAGSTEAVGQRTTESIVYSMIIIFIVNYVISSLFYLIK